MEPSGKHRLLVAIAIGIVAAAYVAAQYHRLGGGHHDFDQVWLGARAVIRGENPYGVPLSDLGYPLFYPVPALLIVAPLSWLPLAWAGSAFFGFGSGLLAYGMLARGWWGLAVFVSGAFVSASQGPQWSPILTGAALVPAAGFLLATKPTMGVALWAGWPTKEAVIGGGLLGILSFVVMPGWIPDWLAAVRTAPHHPLIFVPGGVLMLLSLLRWKRPEARFLAILACVPSTILPYEWVPLFLVPQTAKEAMILALLTDLAILPLVLVQNGVLYDWVLHHQAFVALVLVYLPTLVMVLRRPNEAAGPSLIAVAQRV